MRYAIIAMLLCACASLNSKRGLTPIEVEAGFKEFSREFFIENFDKAKAIADQKKLDRQRIVTFVTTAMWQKVILTKEIGLGTAKEISKKFQFDRATEEAFAVKVFDFYIKNDFCEMATDVVLYFNLGPAYTEKAIDCAGSTIFPLRKARLACRLFNIKEFKSKLIDGWVNDFKQVNPAKRDHDSMAIIAAICPLTDDQYSELFTIGLQDNKPEFAKLMLDKGKFKKTLADYDKFIAMAVAQYQCGLAATVAFSQNLSDSTVEGIFLNPKCLGGTLREVDLASVPSKKAEWFFDLSLRAREFVLARRIIGTFALGKNYFEKVVREGLAANDYAGVLSFEPWGLESAENYRDDILNKVLNTNEEWAVTRFVMDNLNLFTEVHRNAWIERAFLHAFRRGAYDLAADIAFQHTDLGFTAWGIRLAFDAVLQTKNADSAKFIAKRYHLDNDALRRVAVLYLEVNKEKAKKRALELKRECEASKSWKVERCK